MSENAFRIEINDSQYRRVFLIAVLALFCASIWLWKQQVIPHPLLIQCALTFVFLAWFAVQIRRREPQKILMLKEAGEVSWLEPADDMPWKVSRNSRFNGTLMWLVLENSLAHKRQTMVIFNDSVSTENWRHLCRIAGKQ